MVGFCFLLEVYTELQLCMRGKRQLLMSCLQAQGDLKGVRLKHHCTAWCAQVVTTMHGLRGRGWGSNGGFCSLDDRWGCHY